MKKQISFLAIAFFLMGGLLKAQTNQNWHPVVLTPDGTNTVSNVEVNYQLASSGGNDVVLVELINRNTNPVKVQWKDIVITKNGQNLSGNNSQESVNIAPKSRASDDLNNTIQITIKLSDLQTNATNFKSFSVSNFNVIAAQ